MNLIPINPSEAFTLNNNQRQSFARNPAPYRISGPPGLARLVMRRDDKLTLGSGEYWFSEKVFSNLRQKAKGDLAGRNPSSGGVGGASLKEMIGLYMKLCFRNDLAVSKNWSQSFDGYAVLPLRPVDSLVAWVGPIKNQYNYSKPDPAKHPPAEYATLLKLHQQAVASGSMLLATEQQFVIDLNFPANKAFAQRVLGPYEF